MIPVEELAQELHEGARRTITQFMVPWENLSEVAKEMQRNFARLLLKRLDVRTRQQAEDYDRVQAQAALRNANEVRAIRDKAKTFVIGD